MFQSYISLIITEKAKEIAKELVKAGMTQQGFNPILV